MGFEALGFGFGVFRLGFEVSSGLRVITQAVAQDPGTNPTPGNLPKSAFLQDRLQNATLLIRKRIFKYLNSWQVFLNFQCVNKANFRFGRF